MQGIMTREEAKEIALKWCKDGIDKYGEDAIFAAAPQPGKNTWTWKEALDSILNDTVLENTNENIIDSVVKYYEYLNKM